MELVIEHEKMCKKIVQIIEERIVCDCNYGFRYDDNHITAICFTVDIKDYGISHTHEVHIRELEMCIERNNGSVLPIANSVVDAVKTAVVNGIFREDGKYYDPQRAI